MVLDFRSHKITIPGASAGLLHGKTLAVKDCIPICGVPMVNGTNLMDKYVPDFDATVVDRALTAGQGKYVENKIIYYYMILI